MRLLLDNCVPRKLSKAITGHYARTAADEGLARLSDADLLDAIEGRFDGLVTVDQSLRYQQNMAGRTIMVGIIAAKSNRLEDLLPHVDHLLQLMESASPGQFVMVP
jgi:hypothetical protein